MRPSSQPAQPTAREAKNSKNQKQPKQAPSPTSKVRVDENAIVDLHVNDEDLANVLEMLSIQSHRNIVASKDVSARVTANLYNVTFFEALDAILNINGYGYIEDGNFIYVYTKEELKQLEIASRVKVSKVVRLNYLNAIDAAEFVKPLLSDEGQIKTPGKTVSFPSLGETPIGSDEYANEAMLVVIDFESNVAEVEALVRQIDTRPAQVLVEATILQTQLNEANAFGVDFSLIADMEFSEFVGVGGPLQSVNSLIGGRATTGGSLAHPADEGGSGIASTVGNTASPGGLKIGVVSNDVAVFMRVLDEVTDSTILSNPKIMTLNRQPSRVLVGRKVGYLQTSSTDTTTTQSVEFLDTGTQLYFRPFVTNDGMIRMELKPQVSEAVIRESNGIGGGAVTIPDEITNELVTNVIVRDGQTIVLGGLFRESTETSRRQVPFLGDVPIIGSAFRGHDDSTERNEIIFLITPNIVNDAAIEEYGTLAADAVERTRAGAREGVLRWSRSKLTANKNIEADRLAKAGDTQRALWLLDNSLRLNPNQPDAIAMRERLGGTARRPWPSNSLLNEILHGEKPAQKATFDFTSSTAPGSPTTMVPESGSSWSEPTTTSTTTTSATSETASTGSNDGTQAMTNTDVTTTATSTQFTPTTATTDTNTDIAAQITTEHSNTALTGLTAVDRTANVTTTGTTTTTPAGNTPAQAGVRRTSWVNRGLLGGAWRYLRNSDPAPTPTVSDAEVTEFPLK
jgi:type IV pilus secretin PilQ/predicted competence protein